MEMLRLLPGRIGVYENHSPIHLDEKEYTNDPMPLIRECNGCLPSKQGSDGLPQQLRDIVEMPLEQLERTCNYGYSETEILAGLSKNQKRGSFSAIEEQLRTLEEGIDKTAKALQTLRLEVGWLKKLSSMKW